MLLEAKKLGHQISEVPIETVYLEENKSSFRPIREFHPVFTALFKVLSCSCLASDH